MNSVVTGCVQNPFQRPEIFYHLKITKNKHLKCYFQQKREATMLPIYSLYVRLFFKLIKSYALTLLTFTEKKQWKK